LDRRFRISLRHQVRDEGKTALTLGVAFPSTYPKSLPKLKLEFDEDTHRRTRAKAEDVIKSRPKALLGAEMIFEIATLLQDVLDNVPHTNAEEIPTLDEERTAREQVALLEAQQIEDDRRRHALQAANEKNTDHENQLLLELVERERNRAALRRANLTSSSTQLVETQNIPGGFAFEQPSREIRCPNGRRAVINVLHQRTVLRRGPASTVSTIQPWDDSDYSDPNGVTPVKAEADAPFLALKQCHFVIDDETRGHNSRLESILDLHTKLKAHPSILPLLNFRIQRSTSKEEPHSSSADAWTVIILMQLASQGSLMDLIETVETLDIKKVRSWSIQILEGLHHYHRHGTAHGLLTLTNILLERDEAKSTVVKLSDGGYQIELHSLVKRIDSNWSLTWTAPESAANPRAEILPSRDIWSFGVCFVQMAFGLDTVNRYGSPIALQNELHLSDSLAALLSQVFHSDPKKRPSAWDLLHFEFFRNDDALLTEAGGSVLSESLLGGKRSWLSPRNRRESVHAAPVSSRYAKEFVEDGKLGRGGFGEVFRGKEH